MAIDIISDPITDTETGEKLINVTISNSAVKFLKSCVAGFTEGKYGDPDDPKQQKLGKELDQDLHEVWKLLNPS